jgi:hypothetical protein
MEPEKLIDDLLLVGDSQEEFYKRSKNQSYNSFLSLLNDPKTSSKLLSILETRYSSLPKDKTFAFGTFYSFLFECVLGKNKETATCAVTNENVVTVKSKKTNEPGEYEFEVDGTPSRGAVYHLYVPNDFQKFSTNTRTKLKELGVVEPILFREEEIVEKQVAKTKRQEDEVPSLGKFVLYVSFVFVVYWMAKLFYRGNRSS